MNMSYNGVLKHICIVEVACKSKMAMEIIAFVILFWYYARNIRWKITEWRLVESERNIPFPEDYFKL